MDPRAFCEEVVWLNVGYLVTSWDDTRLAFNAVASLDALAAHMYFWCIENGKLSKAECSDDVGYRVGLAKRNDEFRLLRDVAKLQKHVMLTRGNPCEAVAPGRKHAARIQHRGHGRQRE